MRYKTVISFILFLLASDVIFAQKEEEEIVKLEWYVFSDKYDSYIPAKEIKKKVSFFLPQNGTQLRLNINAPEQTSLFLNNRLINIVSDKGFFSADLDSLGKIYGKGAFMTAYHPILLKNFSTKISKRGLSEYLSNQPILKGKNNKADFFIISSILLLIAVGIIRKNLSIQYAYILGVRQMYLSQIIDSPIYSSSFFSRESIQFYSVLSIAIAILILYFIEGLNVLLPTPEKETIWIYSGYMIFYAGLVYIGFYFKFLFYKFLSEIYNFRKFALIQNYDFLRVLIFTTMFYFLLMLIDLLTIQIQITFLFFVPLLTLFVFIFTSYRKLNKLYSHTKLHLFSYLCVSEIIPGLFFTGILG